VADLRGWSLLGVVLGLLVLLVPVAFGNNNTWRLGLVSSLRFRRSVPSTLPWLRLGPTGLLEAIPFPSLTPIAPLSHRSLGAALRARLAFHALLAHLASAFLRQFAALAGLGACVACSKGGVVLFVWICGLNCHLLVVERHRCY